MKFQFTETSMNFTVKCHHEYIAKQESKAALCDKKEGKISEVARKGIISFFLPLSCHQVKRETEEELVGKKGVREQGVAAIRCCHNRALHCDQGVPPPREKRGYMCWFKFFGKIQSPKLRGLRRAEGERAFEWRKTLLKNPRNLVNHV